jgi:tetratricopeptide (TPR) repeat protein
MILLIAAAVASACPSGLAPEAQVCRATEAGHAGNNELAATGFEQAAAATTGDDFARARMLAAAGNMWIAAGQPGKAALALDRALAGTSLRAEQRGEALLDRARAAEAQNDLRTARAKVTEAAQTISADPFLWYFSAALAIRENDPVLAQQAIARALSLAPGDPTVLFEAGHVAHFRGELAAARDYWSRAAAADPSGATGKAARQALNLLPVPVTTRDAPAKTR